MSMAWMPVCGQTWFSAAAAFVGMWAAMMVTMMLPSVLPALWRYHQAARRVAGMRAAWLTVLAGIGYFFVWSAFGLMVFAAGAALAVAEMRQPALALVVPLASAMVVLVAGAFQFTAWKARHLACCMTATGCGDALTADAGTAWRTGLRLGLHCGCSCAGLTAILLVTGVMDLRTMATVAAAIAAERLAPQGSRVARAVGAILIGAGGILMARAAGLG